MYHDYRAPRRKRGSLIAPFVVFGLLLLVTVIFLLTAATLYLGELLGSMTCATLCLGGFFALVALVVYLASVRPAVARIHYQVERVRAVFETVHDTYLWIVDRSRGWLASLLGMLLRKL